MTAYEMTVLPEVVYISLVPAVIATPALAAAPTTSHCPRRDRSTLCASSCSVDELSSGCRRAACSTLSRATNGSANSERVARLPESLRAIELSVEEECLIAFGHVFTAMHESLQQRGILRDGLRFRASSGRPFRTRLVTSQGGSSVCLSGCRPSRTRWQALREHVYFSAEDRRRASVGYVDVCNPLKPHLRL